jgi:1,4-alpha-glucan branching enzyme
MRFGKKERLLVIHSFTPIYLPEYFIALEGVNAAREIFNTDREEFGGSGKLNPNISVDKRGVTVQIPPLATMILELS